jgi:hypothetical protein
VAIAAATLCGVTLSGALWGGTGARTSPVPRSFVLMVSLDVDVLQNSDGVFREDHG